MDVKLLTQDSFRYPAILAAMLISCSCPSCLTLPIRAIIRIKPATPRRICPPRHIGAMSFVKALFRAIVVFAHSITFSHKYLAARFASNLNLCIRGANNAFRSLPCTATLSRAKIMSSYCAGHFLKDSTAPIADYINFVFCAFGRAINHLSPLYAPERGVKFLVACRAYSVNPFCFIFRHASIIPNECRAVKGSGSEMIGVHLAGWEEIVGIEQEREYIEIAEARLAHWVKNDEELYLF